MHRPCSEAARGSKVSAGISADCNAPDRTFVIDEERDCLSLFCQPERLGDAKPKPDYHQAASAGIGPMRCKTHLVLARRVKGLLLWRTRTIKPGKCHGSARLSHFGGSRRPHLCSSASDNVAINAAKTVANQLISHLLARVDVRPEIVSGNSGKPFDGQHVFCGKTTGAANPFRDRALAYAQGFRECDL